MAVVYGELPEGSKKAWRALDGLMPDDGFMNEPS